MKNLLRFVPILLLMTILYPKSGIAQLVYIPDSAFRSYLNQNFAGCMIGDSIDPTCPGVLNAKSIIVANRGITDLSGIEVFINDTLLYCNNNLLTTIPALPPSLRQLRCFANQLTSLPALPSTLTQLICFSNQLTALPVLPPSLVRLHCGANLLSSIPSLPNTLDDFNCSMNQISALPPLPNSIKYLICGYNQLTNLPNLPWQLFQFDCSYNQITSLPTLPPSLKYLACSFNQLPSLPVLPISLETLTCFNNQITSLPPLPPSLVFLSCSSNQLSSLPGLPASLINMGVQNNLLTALPALPTGLKTFYCMNNQLTSLPPFPDSLEIINFAENQISSIPEIPPALRELTCRDNPISCLPELNQITQLIFSNTQVSCLPSYGLLQSSTPAFNGFPVCDVFNPNGCEVFWNIEGTAFFDTDSNCIIGTNDVPIKNQKISLYKNGLLDQQAYTNSKGDYDFDTESTGNYITVYSTNAVPFYVACPLSGAYLDTLTTTDSMKYDRNFGLNCLGTDLAATSIYCDPPRPGSIRTVKIQAGDYAGFFGSVCAQGINGTVNITLSGPAQFHSVPAWGIQPSSVNVNVITYTIADFGTIDYDSSFNINIAVSILANLGSQINISVAISTNSPETNYSNNLISESFTVVGSFDPNDKSVYPDSTLDISGDRWLTYTIRFQNTGTASAEHIYITDTLSHLLDRSSFELLSFSHEPLTQIFPSGLLRFNYPHINLPDSNSNEPESHGYVKFRIKAKAGMMPGNIIQNTANIFFDFNAPVITNTTENLIINCALPPTLIQATICEKQFYLLNGVQYFQSGSYSQKLRTSLGCDSVVILNLTVIPESYPVAVNICPGSSYNFNGLTLTAPGIYVDSLTGSLGCDSIVLLELAFNNHYLMNQQFNICPSDSVLFGGSYLNQPGIYLDTLQTTAGCDSIIELELTQSTFNNTIFQTGLILQTTQTGTTYQWINCFTNTALIGGNSISYSPSQSGNYAVIVSDGYCSDTSNCIFFSSTGLNEITANIQMNANYESGSDIFNIFITGLPRGGLLSLSDLRGRKITTLTLPSDGNSIRQVQLPAYDLARGMYLIHLESAKTITFLKVVK